jgi:hypothetical protein
MDSKITLSFDNAVIEKAKKYAAKHKMSLSRLTEFLYRQVTSNPDLSVEQLPISDWVFLVAEGEAEYVTKKRGRKAMKKEYHESKAKK